MIRKYRGATGVRHQVYSTASGAKRYVGTYDSDRAARQALQDYEVRQRAIARGELPAELDLERTLAAAAADWIASLEHRKARSASIYRKRLDLYVTRELGPVPIAKITTTHVMDLRDRYARTHSPSTVNGIVTCLSSAFTHFQKRQWVTSNPCRGVEPVEDPLRDFAWLQTRDDITRLLAACAGDLREMVAVAVGTGLRLDELLHLQWADVDVGRRLLTVHRGKHGTVKSGKLRRVPILDAVLPVLRERALRRGGDVLVFPGRGGGVRTKQAVRTIFKLALARAGLDQALRWHDLRHTFASWWMMDGGCIFKLAKVLGHHSVTVTERRYAHLSPTAFDGDYGRVGFVVPSEAAPIYKLHRDANGRIVGRDAGRLATG